MERGSSGVYACGNLWKHGISECAGRHEDGQSACYIALERLQEDFHGLLVQDRFQAEWRDLDSFDP